MSSRERTSRIHDTVAVVDFGGQYAHLIATKVRRAGVMAEIRQPEDPIEAFRPYRGVILSGSPSLSSRGEDSDYTRAIYDLAVPILGFCFGHQEIAKHYGGRVTHGGREWGPADLHILEPHVLFQGLDPVERVWMSHFDSVEAVGPGFRELGFTVSPDGAPDHRYAAIACDERRRYGFQFHPEVDDTTHGAEMIANFVFRICGCRATWDMQTFLEGERERIRLQVGARSVFLLASGGVDSTVSAAVLRDALGPSRVHLLHVDNGLMRMDESLRVLRTFRRMGLADHLHFVDATDEFLDALMGLTDPEAKRRAIGEVFVRVFEREARRLGLEDFLFAQGTIYPDTVETGGTKRADVIKTHHNRVPVIEEMLRAGRVVEPLAELYKVEVRELGQRLGVPDAVLDRHPFPGPGLGVRLLCSEGKPDREGFEELQPAASREAARFGLEALALPLRSVGVKADLRAYEHPLLLSGDAPWATVLDAASTLTTRVPGVNRCLWNLAPGSPRSADVVPALTTRTRLALLRRADQIVMDSLRRHGVYDQVWQCPTVLLPLSLDEGPGETVVVRPVRSLRAMTAAPVELPPALLAELRIRLLGLTGVGGLALDVTSKPPGTIEWE